MAPIEVSWCELIVSLRSAAAPVAPADEEDWADAQGPFHHLAAPHADGVVAGLFAAAQQAAADAAELPALVPSSVTPLGPA